MAKVSKFRVYQNVVDNPVVPVFYHNNIETCKEVIGACYEGGIRSFEFTNRGDRAHLVFQDLYTWAANEFPDLLLGVGTIIDPVTAVMYIQLGADFVVSPLLSKEVLFVCNRRQIACFPGCATPTEVSQAHEWGAEIVKVFPGGSVGGFGFVKDILGPLPQTKIMVTGGVKLTEDNIREWFTAGVVSVGIGSSLFPKEVVEKKEWCKVSENCAIALALAHKYQRDF